MKTWLIEALQRSLERVESGEPPEDALPEAPGERRLLGPLLRVAQGVRKAPAPRPSDAFRARLEREILSWDAPPSARARRMPAAFRWGGAALAAAVTLVLLANGVSADTPLGGLLAPVRRASQQVELWIQGDDPAFVRPEPGAAAPGPAGSEGLAEPARPTSASAPVESMPADDRGAAPRPTRVPRVKAAEALLAAARPSPTARAPMATAPSNVSPAAFAVATSGATAAPSATASPPPSSAERPEPVPTRSSGRGSRPTSVPSATATPFPSPTKPGASPTLSPTDPPPPPQLPTVSTPPPGPAPGEGVIAGFVRLPGGAPVAGATVDLLPAEALALLPDPGAGPGPAARPGQEPLRSVVSGSDGGFRFEDLEDGDYGLFAFLEEGGAGWSRFGFLGGPEDPLVLAEDRRALEDLDLRLFVEIPPPGPLPPSSCQERGGSIRGRVTREDGTPVRDAWVLVIGSEPAGPPVSTDGRGDYLAAGLCLEPQGAVLAAAGDEAGFYDPDGDGEPDPVPLSVAAPQAEGIDIVIRPGVELPVSVPAP